MEQFYSAFGGLIFNWPFSHVNANLPKIKHSLKPLPSPLTTCHPPNISVAGISHVLGKLSGRETLPSPRCEIFRVVFLLCTIWKRLLDMSLPNLEGARTQTEALVNTCEESVCVDQISHRFISLSDVLLLKMLRKVLVCSTDGQNPKYQESLMTWYKFL